jgi:hypothetical protein
MYLTLTKMHNIVGDAMMIAFLEDNRRSSCKRQSTWKLISNYPSKLILREFKGGGDQGSKRVEEKRFVLAWRFSTQSLVKFLTTFLNFIIFPKCKKFLKKPHEMVFPKPREYKEKQK